MVVWPRSKPHAVEGEPQPLGSAQAQAPVWRASTSPGTSCSLVRRLSAGVPRPGIPIRRRCGVISKPYTIFATQANRPCQSNGVGCRHRPLRRPVARHGGALARGARGARAGHLVARANLPRFRIRLKLPCALKGSYYPGSLGGEPWRSVFGLCLFLPVAFYRWLRTTKFLPNSRFNLFN